MELKIVKGNLPFHRKMKFSIIFYSVDRTSKIFALLIMFHVFRTIRPSCKCMFLPKISQIFSRNSRCLWCHMLVGKSVHLVLVIINRAHSVHWPHRMHKADNYRKVHPAYHSVNSNHLNSRSKRLNKRRTRSNNNRITNRKVSIFSTFFSRFYLRWI